MSSSKTRERRKINKQSSSNRNLILGGVGIIAAVVIVAVILVMQSNQSQNVDPNSIPDKSVSFPIVGREHIPVGSPRPDYNSNPPTSGPHYDTPIPAGVYQDELPDENLVHNLEHGHIWLSYRDQSDTEALDALASIQSQFPTWVIVTYRPEDDTRVAAAAWGRLLTLDTVNTDAIMAFILRYRDKAPESIPG